MKQGKRFYLCVTGRASSILFLFGMILDSKPWLFQPPTATRVRFPEFVGAQCDVKARKERGEDRTQTKRKETGLLAHMLLAHLLYGFPKTPTRLRYKVTRPKGLKDLKN